MSQIGQKIILINEAGEEIRYATITGRQNSDNYPVRCEDGNNKILSKKGFRIASGQEVIARNST